MSCENCEESAYVIDRLAKLLAEIAVIVNGVEPHDTSWSYHDLPEKVRALTQAQQPAAAVPADTDRLLFLQKFMQDLGEVQYTTEKGCRCMCCWTFSLSGGEIDVEGETLAQAIDAAMLAADARKGMGDEA